MPKVLLIVGAGESVPVITVGNIVATVTPGEAALAALRQHQPDLVITNLPTAELLNAMFANTKVNPRSYVTASTHQGIQSIPINEVNYFQAEHKYVVAHHLQGELLIDDSIASLEQEFVRNFVRVHRKTLVAIAKIEKLYKDASGQHFIKMANSAVQLQVSRRQLPKVRKILLCK